VNGEVGEHNSCIASNIASVMPKFIEYGNLACIGRCARRFGALGGVEIVSGSGVDIAYPITAQHIQSQPITEDLMMQQIRAMAIRPIVVWSEPQNQGSVGVALEVLSLDGEQFVIVLSGEGLKALAQDIESFFQEHPQLAEMKSRPRQ
jgi:hypothetical protein